MKIFLLISLLLTVTASATPDHNLYTAILSDHVKGEHVDYAALRSDKRLPLYLSQLAQTDPASLPSDQARLAFWLNAYNAYTLQLVVEHQPTKSITDIGKGGLVIGTLLKTTAWDIRFAAIGGRKYTLNEIEHEIIRQKFQDSRAHFALNCASGSCPILRTEAYTSDQLEEQLDDQARDFLGDEKRNRFELETKTAWLSSIFKWYQKDFGKNKHAALLAAAQYAPDDIRQSIEADPKAWKVKYLSYDWSLNSASQNSTRP